MDQELTYRLGDSVLDLSRGTLLRDGEAVPMRPKTLRLLSYLVRHAGRAVSRDELHAAIWPRSVVLDGALVRCVREARQSIGDERHDIIHTVAGRGYMCLPAGTDIDQFHVLPGASDDIDCESDLGEPKVTVMPFNLRGIDGTMRPAFDTIVQEIKGAIAKSRVVVVQPATRKRPSPDPAAEIDFLVEGQVMAGAPHLNVVVTLSDARSGHRLLTQSFFLKAESVLAFHQDVARQVVSALVFNIETASWQGSPQGTTSLHMW